MSPNGPLPQASVVIGAQGNMRKSCCSSSRSISPRNTTWRFPQILDGGGGERFAPGQPIPDRRFKVFEVTVMHSCRLVCLDAPKISRESVQKSGSKTARLDAVPL